MLSVQTSCIQPWKFVTVLDLGHRGCCKELTEVVASFSAFAAEADSQAFRVALTGSAFERQKSALAGSAFELCSAAKIGQVL